LNLYDVGAMLGNGHEKYPIQKGDFVMFSYGYNDFQRRILEHNEISDDIITDAAYTNISNLLDAYIDKIKCYKKDYGIFPVINCIYPNPRDYARGVNTVNIPVVRSILIQFANEYLANKCHQNSIIFFDIYDLIVDGEGFIKAEYTSDGIHLNYNDFNLRDMIDNLLVEKCQKHLELFM
jgi:lysophospholipase L1-like esterase